MTVVEVFRQVLEGDEVIVTPTVASHEGRFVLFTYCLACGIEAD
jgi:hypothetical protein